MIYLFALSIAFILSTGLTLLVKILATKLGIFDLPAPRKIHKRPTPLLGGVAIYLAFSLTAGLFWFNGYLNDSKINNYHITAILIGGLILIIGGLLDDKYNIKPHQQLIFPVLATLTLLLSGAKILFVTNPLGGIIEFPVFLGTVTTFFWIMGMIYTTKFLDGLDALTSGITAIGSIIIFIVSLYWDVSLSGTSILALILAGSTLGFLIFNWHPAKIFLGEGGSVLCGFLLGTLSIISGSKIATALLIMGIPILDVAWVIVQRLWFKKSPAIGDRRHLHYRLLDLGLSHRQTVIFLYFITAVSGTISLFLHSKGKVLALVVLAVFMIVLASLVLSIHHRKHHEI
ncbi:MAG: MraY family glycosyltransferase [Patescibacteria group bacterium]|jgi:UDP-GlcNAc:undecaprenyl-phosphate GlcNAc-1-phosphate transferase|nr:MraY family glycosyltransferase [Patescibacteria group bacterium]